MTRTVATAGGPVDATVALPGSKSITNRALVCAALAVGTSRLDGVLDADDTRAMVDSLRRCGVGIAGEPASGTLTVHGGLGTEPAVVDARQSGTTSRFLLPVLATDAVARRMDGDEQLLARPMQPVLDALRRLGADVIEHGAPGHLPVTVSGPLSGSEVAVTADVSSQFLSGLLLAAPQLSTGLRISVPSVLISRPYVDMTAAVMRAFGAEVSGDDGRSWQVGPGGYRGADLAVEPDASAASYAWAAAVVTGGRVTVPGLTRHALQGDVGFVDVLADMGAVVVERADGLTVGAGDRLVGVDVDAVDISDTVPTLAAVAAVAEGTTTIRGVGFIRHKESDRIAAPVAALQACGVDAHETDDGMVIHGNPALGIAGDRTRGVVAPATVVTHDDHRMAMAFGVLGLRRPNISITQPDCVAKTFPTFWDFLDRLRRREWPPAADG